MFDLERYLEEIATANYGGNQDQVTWVEIRGHVRATFLHLNELAALQAELRKMKRKTHETPVGYCRRFREAADHSYPVAN